MSGAKGHYGATASRTAGLLRAFVPVHICVHVLLTCKEREVLLMGVMWLCVYLKHTRWCVFTPIPALGY